MPYNPGVTDISGQLLAQGINGAVNGIAQNQKAIYASKDELEKELAHINGTVSFARQQGILTPEDMDTYITGNMTKKRELAVKAGMGYEAMIRQQQMNQSQQRIDLQGRGVAIDEKMAVPRFDAATVDAAIGKRQLDFQPTEADIAVAGMSGKTYVNTGKGPTLEDLAPAPLQLTAEELAQYKQAGQVPLRMSSGQVIPKPAVKEGTITDDPATWPRTTLNGREVLLVPKEFRGITGNPTTGNAAKPATPADAIMISAKVGEAQKLDAEMQKIQSGKGWYGVFDTKGTRDEKLQELAQKRSEVSAYLGSLGRDDAGRPLGGVPTPAPLPKGTSSANRSAINNALPLPESDGLPPLPEVQLVKVSGPDEAAKLPPGTKFQTPDGRILTRK